MKRTLSILLIALGLLTLFFSLGTYLLNRALASPSAAPLPDQIADLPRITQVYGAEAVVEINRLHVKEFLLTSGAVGVYWTKNQATLWVSGAPLEIVAQQILIAMRDKIAEGNSPFQQTGERQDVERIVYELDGLGQKHFYFRSGKLIVWVGVDEPYADRVLVDILEFFP